MHFCCCFVTLASFYAPFEKDFQVFQIFFSRNKIRAFCTKLSVNNSFFVPKSCLYVGTFGYYGPLIPAESLSANYFAN